MSLLINRFDDELLVVKRDVADLGPREADLRAESVGLVVDVEAEGVDSQVEVGSLLVTDLEVLKISTFQI